MTIIDGSDDKAFYERIDAMAACTGDEVISQVLFDVMGLVFQNGSYVLSPPLRDRCNATMRRWLVDHGYLPRHNGASRPRLTRHPDDI